MSTGTLAATELKPGVYDIDTNHGTIEAVARHMMFTKVRGRFSESAGTITIGETTEESGAEIEFQAASITTGQTQRDEHLRSPDFLDVETFPTLNFKSTSVRQDGDRVVVVGDLTIRGVTNPIEIDARIEGTGVDPWGNDRIMFSGKAQLDREAYGMTWNQALETGGILVSKKFDIEIDVSAVRRADA